MNDPKVVDSLLAGQTDLLTIDEIAELMRVSQTTVMRWIKEQGLPGITVGPRLRRVQREDLRQWLLHADEIEDTKD